ncbi:MAG TPA: glycosyl hydrolase [Planctomycetes bacterium]|nr:glycosyl hydrolase [Planctomycetota bacterium]
MTTSQSVRDSTGLSRRGFIAAGAGALAATLPAARAAPAPEGPAKLASPVRLGVIGTGGRGTYLMTVALGLEDVEVTALCDINAANLARAVETARAARGTKPAAVTGGPFAYRDLLKRDDVDAVIVTTPMQLHAPMSVDAMRAGKHVLSEVAAAMTLDECWALVAAAEETGRTYMLAENCCYWKPILTIAQMLRAGLFGDCTFAECGYVHDCRSIQFAADGSLTWRGEMNRDARGNLYPTHSLGPVAQWLGINRGDRLAELVAMDTKQASLEFYARRRFGADHAAAATKFAVGDSTTTLIRTARGACIDLRYDTCSARPHPSTTYYALQGVTASYDSRLDGIWIDGRSKEYAWERFGAYAGEFEPPLWKTWGEAARTAGHEGGDFFVIREFIDALLEGRPAPIDAADAAAWSSIIPLSAASLRARNAPQEIPDFTRGRWETRSA